MRVIDVQARAIREDHVGEAGIIIEVGVVHRVRRGQVEAPRIAQR